MAGTRYNSKHKSHGAVNLVAVGHKKVIGRSRAWLRDTGGQRGGVCGGHFGEPAVVERQNETWRESEALESCQRRSSSGGGVDLSEKWREAL